MGRLISMLTFFLLERLDNFFSGIIMPGKGLDPIDTSDFLLFGAPIVAWSEGASLEPSTLFCLLIRLDDLFY